MYAYKQAALAFCLLVCFSQFGCHVMDRQTVTQVDCSPGEIQVERGRKIAVVDGVGWVVGIPGKIALWNHRVENHRVSEQTEQELRHYMAANGLYDTKVRINQYAPVDEWRRLTKNDRVAPGWRYTFGVLNTFGYTIFPGRIFGGDGYNPYTNSVYVYSDVPSLALVGAAYAKDVNTRVYPGTYAFTQELPGFNMIHETINTEDVLKYYADAGSTEQLREADEILYPRYGLALGNSVANFIVIDAATGGLELVGLLGGHAVGRYQAAQIEEPAAVTQVSFQPEGAGPIGQ